MAASKRDFVNFHDFPGSVNDGKGIYEFPELRKIDSMDRVRIWRIFVRLVKDTNRQSGIDWNLLDEKQVKIKDKYFEVANGYSDLPNGVIAEVWAENGLETGKITRNAPSYFDTVAHKGRANQRNPFQQALIRARADYLKREERGGSKNKSAKKTKRSTNVMYFPMLAKTWKDGNKHLRYPLYIQPKLDGVRCLVYLKKKNGGVDDVVVYSRTQKEFPAMEYLKEVLYPYLNELFDDSSVPHQSIYLDGELYRHGDKLQDISGRSRNDRKRPNLSKRLIAKKGATKKNVNETKDNTGESKNTINKTLNLATLNQYHMYDCFYPLELDTQYEDRKEQLEELYDAIKGSDAPDYKYLPANTHPTDIVKLTPTKKVSSLKAATKLYNKYITNDYEGVIFRNVDGEYLAHPTKTSSAMRSKNLVKMKQKFTDEYEVVGFTEGRRGKDKGAIIWICKTTDDKKFNVTPKDITYEKRYELFKKAQKAFDTKYKGRMITVEYEDLSKAGVPQRAKSMTFRDYE